MERSRTSPNAADVELQGSVRQFSLADVVQFLSASKKTGRLGLESGKTSGAIYFESGAVVHCEAGGSEGEDAFFALVLWTDGRFEFTPGARSSRKSVRGHNAALLLEGARRSDEWSVLSEQIPDTRLVPEFVAPDESQTGKQITLNTSEWMVLSKIDGARCLRDIARDSGLSDYQVCRLIYPLVRNHLIRLREP
jgi:hypothetical protein